MGIDVLGPVQLGAGEPPLSRRDRIILSALTLEHGEVLSPDRLADALWGEQPPKSWPKVVQGSMMRLRRALGVDAIETTTGGYRLNVADGDIDALRFEQLLARARSFIALHEPARAVTAYEQSLALWRGSPFADLDGWDAGRAEAARLIEVRLTAEEELVAARLAMGHAAEAVAEARRLTAREPYREHRWALLSLALYRCGRQREALAVLRHAGTTLRDELGLDPGAELVDLERALLRQDPELLAVPERPSVTAETCPYKGLRPYGAEDAETFFGRDDAVRDCVARLQDSSLLVVVGPSGSGKSSIVNAGVVPALRAVGHRVAQVTPGPQPLATLTALLAREPGTAVLVVDQLEELLDAPQEEVKAFLDQLVGHADAGSPVVVSLRADYLGGLAASPGFARLAERGLVLVTPMSEAELQLAIEAPATRNGLLLEHGLVDLLVRDVIGEPGGLPLLSHALAETWERREGNVLTVEGYAQTGGIRAAVAQSAERLYESLSSSDRASLRAVLLRLVAPATTGEPLGLHVSPRLFTGSDDVQRLLDVLVRARLVTADSDSVAIAHESLVRGWPRLRGWLDEDVEGQRLFQHLQMAAEGWEMLGRPAEELYRGGRLHSALEWRERTQPALAPSETAFLEQSQTRERERRLREDQQLRAQVRRNRQLRGALVGVVALLVVALVAGSMAAGSGRRARTAAAAADAARLGAEALVQPETDTSLLLARQSVALADTATTEGSLLETLARQRGLIDVGRAPSPVFGGGLWGDQLVSPDGSRLLMSTPDGVALVDTATGRFVTGKPLAPAPDDFGDWPYSVGFVDSGRTVLTSHPEKAGKTKTVALQAFSATDGHRLGAAVRVPGTVASEDWFGADRLRISPDGNVLVSLLHRRIRVWHRNATGWTGPAELALTGFPESVPESDRLASVSFSADGTRAALLLGLQGPPFGQPPQLGFVVDTSSLRLLMPMLAPVPGDYTPTALALSPDGRQLAAGHADGRVTLHPVTSAEQPREILGTDLVQSLAWQADSSRLAVGTQQGGLAIYRMNPLDVVASYPATGAGIMVAALRGERLISQSDNSDITVRSLDQSNGFMTVVPTAFNNALAVGPAGGVVATGGNDGVVSVYAQRDLTAAPMRLDLGPYASADPTASPAEHRRVSGVAVSPDGRTLVAANRLGHLRMWSLPQGRLLWSRDDVRTSFLALSKDGRYLATSGFTQDPNDKHPDSAPISTSVTLWDLATRTAVLTDKETGTPDQPNTNKPRAIAFSPDSRLLAAGFFDPPVKIYDVTRHTRSLTIDDAAAALTFTPDGKELLVKDINGLVRGFDPRTGKGVESFRAPIGGYSSLAFSADGRWLVGSGSTSIYVWDAASRRVVVDQLPLPSDGTNDGLFLGATSDNRLFVGTQTSVVSLSMNPSDWNRLACGMAGRTLTKDEWTRFLPSRPYAPACS